MFGILLLLQRDRVVTFPITASIVPTRPRACKNVSRELLSAGNLLIASYLCEGTFTLREEHGRTTLCHSAFWSFIDTIISVGKSPALVTCYQNAKPQNLRVFRYRLDLD